MLPKQSHFPAATMSPPSMAAVYDKHGPVDTVIRSEARININFRDFYLLYNVTETTNENSSYISDLTLFSLSPRVAFL